MPTPNASQIADQLDQLADRIAATEGSAAPAALRMVATALRGDATQAHA